MKVKIHVLSWLLWLTSNIHAQFSLESNFNVVHIGRNQNVLLKYQWDKFSINGGIKYNFNKEYSFPQGQRDLIKKAFWAMDFGEHIGAEVGFQYNFFQKQNIEIFAFYQLQVTKSHIRHEVFYAYEPLVNEPQSEYDYSYILVKNFIGPLWGFENNFGLGFNGYFSDSFYFSVKGGGGIFFFKNLDKQFTILLDGNWTLSEIFSFGLGYKFNSNK